MSSRIDVASNRRAVKWSTRAQIGRICWALVHPLFCWSPHPFWGWRRFLLRRFGARIGRDVRVHARARIEIPWNVTIGDLSAVGDGATLYSLGPITIGERVAISQRAYLCAGSHDFTQRTMPLTKPPIVVESDAWICACAFIGPGVTIGTGSIVGACAVVTKDVSPNLIVAGNPADVIRQRPNMV